MTDGGDSGTGRSWGILVVAGVVVVGLVVWLSLAFGDEPNRLEAIRTAGLIVVVAGGAVGLLLLARRQRSAEIALRQKDIAAARTHELQTRVADDARVDAAERRVTELYTTAVDQLASDKLPVQFGGLYALERLGQHNVDQRQTIVNVLCAYLRMFTDPAVDIGPENWWRQVRQAAAAILAAHLRDGEKHWHDMDIDLTGASLNGFDLSGCRVRSANFRGATFVGDAAFGAATFGADVTFTGATFTGSADFAKARFAAAATFENARFGGDATFTGAVFAATPGFDGVTFTANARFDDATFAAVPFAELAQEDTKALSSLPAHVPYADIAGSEVRSEKLVPIGVGDHDGRVVGIDFEADPHFLAFMGPRSGKTNLLRAVVRGIVDRYTDTEAVVMLVDLRRGLLGYLDTKHLLAYAMTGPQLTSMIADVTKSLRQRLPGPDVTAEQLATRGWWRGPELFVVIDDHELTYQRGAELLAPLAEFVPQAKDVGLHVVLARTTAGAGYGDTLVNALWSMATPGLVGNGDLREGPLVGTAWPSSLMPGRAVVVDRVGGRQLVQIALTEGKASG